MNVMATALLAASVFCAPVFAADIAPIKAIPVKADTLFVQADKNHDGKLDKAEFEVFKKLQEDRLILQIKQRIDKMQFAAFDKDADNMITQDELKAARIEARQKMMQNLRDRQLQIKPVSVTPMPSTETVKK
jgi:hypothetical protein